MSDANSIRLVDKAIDAYIAKMGTRGIDPEGFFARTLASFAKVERGEMSLALQYYRYRQRTHGDTRFIIACEGYGPGARWRIQAKPSSDPKVVRQNRKDHAIYLAQDNQTKLVRDYASEVYPALQGAQLDQVIEIAVKGLVRNVETAVDTAVALIEAQAV